MDPYDSGEEEAVWIIGQSAEGQENDMNSELADHEEGERSEEGSEGQSLTSNTGNRDFAGMRDLLFVSQTTRYNIEIPRL